MKYQITIDIPDEKWVSGPEDLKELLEKESNLWSVTHCDEKIEVKVVV